MKEKTKQILRYVASGLGGLALGIGLLGGLSMCATSENKQTEDVNTILTTERVRHNEQITTANGGYTGYSFSVYSDFGTITIDEGNMIMRRYVVDKETFTLSTPPIFDQFTITSVADIKTAIDSYYETYTATNDLSFLAFYGVVPNYGATNKVSYFTFVIPSGTQGYYVNPLPFVLTNPSSTARTGTLETGGYSLGGLYENNTYYTIPNGRNPYALFDSADGPTRPTFQDIESYYKSMGYTNGHQTGYEEGHQEGYEEGYEDAYAEKDNGIAFTSCGVYPNAHVTLATDETIGNFNYMYLCHYITKPGYDEHTIYIMWTTNANTGQYLGEVIDRNDTDSYDPAVTLGSFTQQATSSVTITATEDMEFGLWVGYITTFHNRGEITNSILWFQGGTAESDMQIYQNGYDEGYQNGNQAGQETGYEQGYERGQEVGDAEGYSRGYTEGFNQTNTKNVFSLFTSAFDSVASFFDLKIFGFLPLYWFFLAPLFIALISLLMRMVKH